MDFFYSAFCCISCAVRTFHTHISHQHSIIGRRYRESFLSVLGCWLYCTYISAQIDCRALSIYLLQEATSSNTYSAAQRAYQLDYVVSSRLVLRGAKLFTSPSWSPVRIELRGRVFVCQISCILFWSTLLCAWSCAFCLLFCIPQVFSSLWVSWWTGWVA